MDVAARIAALTSGDAPAARDALAALVASAYPDPLLPPDGAGGAGAGADTLPVSLLPWLTIAARGVSLTPSLGAALAPLLLDDAFTDDALAPCVPYVAVLALAVQGLASGGEARQTVLDAVDDGVDVLDFALDELASPLITLLLRAVACLEDVDAAASAAVLARTERVLRALCDCACFESEMEDRTGTSVLYVRQAELRGALATLLRLPAPADGSPNVLAGAAAQLLVYLVAENGFWRDPPVSASDMALLRAALAALQDTWSGAHLPAWGGCPYGCDAVLHARPPRALLQLLVRAMDDPERTEVGGTRELTKLILLQPGALAALTRAAMWAQDATLLARLTEDAGGALKLTDGRVPQMQADALCMAALLDGELCLADVMSPTFAALPGGVVVKARVVRACSDAAALELLARPPRGSALPAAVALALLAFRNPEAMPLLPRGDALQTLARAYCRACVAPPWVRAAGVHWRDAAALQQRHARLRWALAVAVMSTRIAPRQRPHGDASPNAKRLRAGTALLSAADVNVRRHDSLTLLVSGEPLYVNSMLIEKASPLLADLISGVAAATSSSAHGGALAHVVVPAPADVAPDALHALMCAAVEHTYTGELPQELPQASVLPLWCVARQLQMDGLRAACAEALASAALRAASDALLARAADVALRHGADEALLRSVAAALLLHGPKMSEEEDTLVADALLCGENGGGEHVGAAADALGDAMVAVLRQPLLHRRA
jgi:hypothetical protein